MNIDPNNRTLCLFIMKTVPFRGAMVLMIVNIDLLSFIFALWFMIRNIILYRINLLLIIVSINSFRENLWKIIINMNYLVSMNDDHDYGLF